MMRLAELEIEYYLPEEDSFYRPVIQQVRSALNPNLWHTPWDQLKGVLTQGHLTHILHTGQRLKTLVPEAELAKEDLDSILSSLEELERTIEELGISETSKHKLRQRCSAIEDAVEEYRFWGVQGIEITLESATSVMVPLVERDAEGKPTIPWNKIINVVFLISKVLDCASTDAQHVHKAYLFLEPTVSIVEQHAGHLIEGIIDKPQ
jgi:hypothetical protein